MTFGSLFGHCAAAFTQEELFLYEAVRSLKYTEKSKETGFSIIIITICYYHRQCTSTSPGRMGLLMGQHR